METFGNELVEKCALIVEELNCSNDSNRKEVVKVPLYESRHA